MNNIILNYILLLLIIFFSAFAAYSRDSVVADKQGQQNTVSREIGITEEADTNPSRGKNASNTIDGLTDRDSEDEFIQKAEQGDAAAQYALGTKYKNGQGVEQNYQEALKWYTKSADQGFADAQVILGAMYYAGQGVGQDKVMAFAWWSKAALQGNEAAQKSLNMLCAESPWACKQEKSLKSNGFHEEADSVPPR